MNSEIPHTKDLLFIGGGHTHALALQQWGMKPLPGVRMTLVNPGPMAPYTGMLPGLIAGHYQQRELEIDLAALSRFAGARLILDYVTGIDTELKLAHFANRPPIAYDLASIDIGITTELRNLPGFDTYSAPAKPLDTFARAWERFLLETQAGSKPPTVAVIGAGVAGVELAMAMAHRLRIALPDPANIKIALIESGPEILAGANPHLRNILKKQLIGFGIKILTGVNVAAAKPDGLVFANHDPLPAAFITTAVGANPAQWLEDTGLALKDGFIRVDRNLRSISHKDIYAVGDIAHMDANPRVKAGVFAVRQAPFLNANLVAALSGGKQKPYRPQSDYLKLISLGGKNAVASKWGQAFWHQRLWSWKNHIDQTFMAQFRELPEMVAPDLPADPVADGVVDMLSAQPLCGGCGSKVAPDILRDGLKTISGARRPDIIRKSGDDAAILMSGDNALQVITTDHFRAFTPDPYILAKIITIHALNDIWAMGADPQAALASIILPNMAPHLQNRTLTEITRGIEDVLEAAGAELVGGHTSLGGEMTLGITATGLMNGRTPLGLEDARDGDALILTKPIGIGTILAAEMQGKAQGNTVAAAYEQMLMSGAVPARHLRGSANAMTDISGFGLAGHLMAMLDQSDMTAKLSLGVIPYCDGAIDLAEVGIQSSIYPDLARLADRISASETYLDDPRFKLLFDPQTSGGLLASIPASKAKAVQRALAEDNCESWQIGTVSGADAETGNRIKIAD